MEANNVPAGEEAELDLQLKARRLVRHYYNHTVVPQGENLPVLIKQVYVVWFSKVLGNWKAMVGTVNNDGLYFEVTHDGAQNLTYVDMYEKQGQMIQGLSANLVAAREAQETIATKRENRARHFAKNSITRLKKIGELHIAGKSNAEIASALGISESSVRSALDD